jgi:RNA polymerase sigma-70 factor (ECF subfamily)
MQRSNETWLAELKGGPAQPAALDELRRILRAGLRRALEGRPSAEEAFLEDVVQDALLRILERLDQFEGRSRFVTWAITVAVHIAMAELRRRRWRNISLDDMKTEAGPMSTRLMDEAPGPVAHRARREILETMDHVIREDLTERQRTVLIAELKGMPLDEIARHLGSNRNAVYKMTHDARRRLRKGLEAAGIGAADIGSAFA